MAVIRAALVLIGALLLAGCDSSSTPAHDWPEPSPALWEVTAPGGQTGWLFGTVHALPDGLEWRTPLLDRTLARAGVLVVEIAEIADGAPPGLFDRLATTPGQAPLLQRVEPAERAPLAAMLARADMSESDFETTESWAAALLLAGAVSSGDPANGVDRALIADSAVRVIGLESYTAQFALFDRLPSPAQDDLLAAVAEEAGNVDQTQMLEAWLTGDDHSLAAMSNSGILGHAELRQALLVDRNAAWAQEVEALVTQGANPLVAVGAAHLVGTYGLVGLLEQRGYSVRRIQ